MQLLFIRAPAEAVNTPPTTQDDARLQAPEILHEPVTSRVFTIGSCAPVHFIDFAVKSCENAPEPVTATVAGDTEPPIVSVLDAKPYVAFYNPLTDKSPVITVPVAVSCKELLAS